MLDVIIAMRALSVADIRSASRNRRDEFERVAIGLVDAIQHENAHADRVESVEQDKPRPNISF